MRHVWMAAGFLGGCGQHWELTDPLQGDCRVQHAWYRDADGDGWGLSDDVRLLCGPDEAHTAERGGDCDDTAAEITGGSPGASCPADLVTLPSGAAQVWGATGDGVELVVVTGADLRLTADQADRACAGWRPPEGPGGAPLPAPGGELSGLGDDGLVAWTDLRWQGAGEGLAGSWDGSAWTGTWVDGAGEAITTPWCDRPGDPGGWAPDLSPADPAAAGTWEDLLGEGRLALRLGDEPCLRVQPPAAGASALGCWREAPAGD